ncbi:MAG: NAD(P)/FAD-dependent oxidoreductase [Deltaproteobacteria bacterium]
MSMEHFDVIIVGAGLSGIAAGYHLQKECPDRSYAILERREAIGGTWDLFRYPGVRSDSDMHTLGYSFRPWVAEKAIADGPSIREYVRDTARDNGIDKKIRYGLQAKRAAWSTPDARWTLETERTDGSGISQITCNFLFMCSGYYNYDKGYTPDFAGMEDFQGQIVHPQEWTDDIVYKDKKVVVIGSGATAVTLVPEMAKTAAHVTMLQRSPTYMVAAPDKDAINARLRRWLPEKLAYALTRWKNILFFSAMFRFVRRYPNAAKRGILKGIQKALGPDFDVKTHFTPSYKPWDQRMCLVPNGDLFKAINQNQASVVTDHIERFTEKGILLKSGRELEADMIVTATGLNLLFLAGLEITVDGERRELSKSLTYKAILFSDIPNLAMAIGYTNASWTLKCDLTCEYIAKLLNYMKKNDFEQVCPRTDGTPVIDEEILALESGYIKRSIDQFPRQGKNEPWRAYQNYLRDILMVRHGKLVDDALVFSTPERKPEAKSGNQDQPQAAVA